MLLLLLLLLSRFSCVQLCATPETAAHQAPPSLGTSENIIQNTNKQRKNNSSLEISSGELFNQETCVSVCVCVCDSE